MKPNRRPGSSWFLREPKPDAYPNGYVRTDEGDMVEVAFFDGERYGQSFVLSRRDARLLAKRINQCLDETTIR